MMMKREIELKWYIEDFLEEIANEQNQHPATMQIRKWFSSPPYRIEFLKQRFGIGCDPMTYDAIALKAGFSHTWPRVVVVQSIRWIRGYYQRRGNLKIADAIGNLQ